MELDNVTKVVIDKKGKHALLRSVGDKPELIKQMGSR